ncbi:MAG: EAL domain-containing protein, partial [Gammaproteobacteria bacterium]
FRDRFLPQVEATGRWRGEAVGRRWDGSGFPQELSLTRLDGGGLVCVVRDISDRKHAEEARLRREDGLRLQQQALLQLVSHDSISQGQVEEAFETVCATAAQTLRVERVGVWLLDPGHTRIRCECRYEASVGQYGAGAELTRDESPVYFEALEQALVIPADDAQTDPKTREFAESYLKPLGIRSMLNAPVRVGRDTVGVLCLEQVHTPRSWSLEEQNFAAALAELLALAIDEHQRRAAETELFREKELAQVTLASIGDGVITTDVNGVIEYLNPVAQEMTGWSAHDARAQPLPRVFNLVDEVLRRAVPDLVRRCHREGGSFCLPSQAALLHRNEDREFAVEVTVSPIRDRNTVIIGTVLVFRDVTELRGMARQMAYQATHDPLTGLINRREFEVRLEQALDSAQTLQREHALCYLDLDQFKVVNDTCGHGAGDELLRQLAARLSSRIRETDILARLGGDEFGVLLEHCVLEQAARIADGLRSAVQEFRYHWQDKTFEIGVSIGLVPLGPVSMTLSEALSAADSACYVAKDQGRNRVHVFQAGDSALARHHGQMQWSQRIRQALNEDRLQLHIQPYRMVTPSRGLDARPAEFLLRMVGEDGALILPREFLPAAERYHLMPDIDRWVVRAVFSVIAQGHPMVRDLTLCGINLSGQSLGDERFLDYVIAMLDEMDIPADRLCFEVTETAAIANLSHAVRFMSVLRGLGCRFALDDFGSGLSSFAYLKNLPVDYLKIDGAFVRDMVDDPIDHAMVEAINQIGHVMNMQTIAECVEDDTTLKVLRLLGVDYAQGYVIARPVPLEPAVQLLRGQSGN